MELIERLEADILSLRTKAVSFGLEGHPKRAEACRRLADSIRHEAELIHSGKFRLSTFAKSFGKS